MYKLHQQIYKINERAESFVLFVHGFMGSPNQFEDFVETVYARGFSCASILLPGHAAPAKTFTKFGADDWHQHLQKEIDTIKQQYKNIYLVGHSMGGLLSLNACCNNNIAGVFLISTPTNVNVFSLRTIFIKLSLIFAPKTNVIKSMYIKSKSISRFHSFFYPSFLKSVVNFYRVLRLAKNNLHKISVPVTMVHSKADEVVAFRSRKKLIKGLSGVEKNQIESVVIYKSLHSYFEENERETISEKLIEFIEKDK